LAEACEPPLFSRRPGETKPTKFTSRQWYIPCRRSSAGLGEIFSRAPRRRRQRRKTSHSGNRKAEQHRALEIEATTGYAPGCLWRARRGLHQRSISAGPCAPASQAPGLAQPIGSAPISPSRARPRHREGCGDLGSNTSTPEIAGQGSFTISVLRWSLARLAARECRADHAVGRPKNNPGTPPPAPLKSARRRPERQ
jgi:hypothetical protein